MKKLLAILLAALLLLSLVACGDDIDDGDGDDHGDGEITEGGKKTDEGYLPYTESEAEAKMIRLAETEGYEYTYTANMYDEEMSMRVGRTKDCFWAIDQEDNTGSAYVKNGMLVNAYDYEDGKWEYAQSVSTEQYDLWIDLADLTTSVWLYYGNTDNDYYKKGGSENVAGRTCDIYSYGDAGFGYSAHYSISVDRELGITMKLNFSASAGTEHASLSYEMTSFKTGSAVNPPELPAVKPMVDTFGFSESDVLAGIATGFKMVSRYGETSFSASLEADPNDIAAFNRYGSAIFEHAKSVSDDGKVYDYYGDEEITAWEDIEEEYAEHYYSYQLNEEWIELTLAYSAGMIMIGLSI